MRQITVGDTSFDINWFSGTVLSSSKGLETRVHGGSAGGNQPVSVSSSTTIHDTIFVEDANGIEKSFQLIDFNVACRPTNQVTFVWMVATTTQNGEYLLMHNHTTNRRVFKERNVKKMTGPNSLGYGLAGLGGMVAAFMVFTFGIIFSMMIGNFLNGLAGLAVFVIALILAPIIFVAAIVIPFRRYNRTSSRYRADFDSEWPNALQAAGL